MLKAIKKNLLLNTKNIPGWKTGRKIVVLSVDDYGNVRVDSKKARENMDKAGLKIYSRFDAFDSLENEEDLNALYEVLSSVKDKNGSHAVLSAFAVPANINFEKIENNKYRDYQYELLPDTFAKLKGYENVYNLWQEGIRRKLIIPHFHGREHLNLKIFNEKLQAHDRELTCALQNRSYTSISKTGYKTISFTAAFDFDQFSENGNFKTIIEDGLNAFEKVFGFRSNYFNPPGGREHPVIHEWLNQYGVRFIDTPMMKSEHQGEGKYKTVFNYTGKKNSNHQCYIVRNCVFEPTFSNGIDWESFLIKQVEVAFKRKKPAIISSHRVNFCGHIEPANRSLGLKSLKGVLQKIVNKWQDVEFMAAMDLGGLINCQV